MSWELDISPEQRAEMAASHSTLQSEEICRQLAELRAVMDMILLLLTRHVGVDRKDCLSQRTLDLMRNHEIDRRKRR